MNINFSKIEAFVKDNLPVFGVPGLSLAIVKGDDIIYEGCFGHKDVEHALIPDPHTRYACASVTKAMTAACLGILRDEGKIDWDVPVTEYLPEFRAFDPRDTARITLRDMLAHNTGLPRHDAVWYNRNAVGPTTEELVAAIAHLPFNKPFRSKYEYNNLMFTTAGAVAARVSGMPWQAFIQKRLFEPLGMHDTTAVIAGLRDAGNRALPYTRSESGPKLTEYCDFDGMAGCGTVNSTIRDMTAWLSLQLGKGSYKGKRIISEKTMAELHTAVVVSPPIPGYVIPQMPLTAYGFGWSTQPFRGRMCLQHSGGIDGFSSYATFMPEQGYGIMLFTNLGGNQLHFATAAFIYDLIWGESGTDWAALYLDRTARQQADLEAANAKILAEALPGTAPTRPLDQYPGLYRHPGYGTLEITDGEPLELRFNGITQRLIHSRYDSYVAEGADAGEGLMPVRFTASADGPIDGVDAHFEPALGAPIHFKKFCISSEA